MPRSPRLLATLLVLPAAFALAQNATSTLVGVVSDPSGAILSNARVTLANPHTGATFDTHTNAVGTFRFPDVPPGPGYTLTVVHPGFATVTLRDVYINVAASATHDVTLTPGETATVEVHASPNGLTLNTDDASVGNNVEVSQLNELPVYNRGTPAVLFSLQPGVAASSVTGARPDQTNVTLDGLDVNDFATGGFGEIIGYAPVDAVQEFRGTVAGFPVNSGPGSGGQFQLVTRSGTNQFHGNLNEYHRDNATAANSWFNDNATPAVRPAQLVMNQFGGSLGGPLRHNRAFFFVNVLQSRIAQQGNVARTVPLPTFADGSLQYATNATGCTAATRQNTTPACIGTLTPAQVTLLDPAGIGASPAVAALLKLYPSPNDLTGGDGLNTASFRFNAANPTNLANYVGKLDFQLTSRLHLATRGAVTRSNAVDAEYAQFPGLPNAGSVSDRSYSYVALLDWQISPTRFNRLAYGANVEDAGFFRAANPLGVNQVDFASGNITLLDPPYSSPLNSQYHHIPIPQVTDDFTWTLGRHTLQLGGFFKWIHATSAYGTDLNTYTLGLGGNLQTLTSSLRPANIYTGSNAQLAYDEALAVTLGRVGEASANFNYSNAGTALPLGTGSRRNYRYFQTLAYAGDTSKPTPRLTLTYGVNYQLFSVPYESNGLETVQTTPFNTYMSARVAQSAAGNISPGAVPLITYLLGGKANNGPGYYHPSYRDLAPRLGFAFQPLPDSKTVFSGGAGLVYDRTVINAIQYQQDQYSYLFTQPYQAAYGTAANPAGSLATDARYDHPPAVTAPSTSSAPFQPYVAGSLPYGLEDGVYNQTIDPNLHTPRSLTANFGIQHEFPGSLLLRATYVGRFGRSLLAQADASQLVDFLDPASGESMGTAVAHVESELRAGQSSRNLPREPWFENVYGALLPANANYPNTTSRVATNADALLLRGDFGDFIQEFSPYAYAGAGYNVGMASQFAEDTMYTNKGFSTYHGLLVSVSQNPRHGLRFDANYTWQHSVDNVSLIANAAALSGWGFVCDVLRPRLCRGNSDFDVTHIVNGDFLYALPLGRNRALGSNLPLWISDLVGNWDLSGIVNAQSGQAFSTASSAFVAGFSNNAPALLTGNPAALARSVHKTSAGAVNLFANPTAAAEAFTGPLGFQIGSRNTLRGPAFIDLDLGLAKTIPLWPSRNVNLKFRADAFNLPNHPNFASPGTNTIYDDVSQPSTFGQIAAVATASTNPNATTTGARVLQLILRLEF